MRISYYASFPGDMYIKNAFPGTLVVHTRYVHTQGRIKTKNKSSPCHTAQGQFVNMLAINYFTIPLKPMKARAKIPTLMMAMGTPLKALGTSFRARCSRMPAKITIARP